MTTTNAIRHLVRPGDRRVAWRDLTPDAPADARVVLFCHAAPGDGSFDPDPAVTAAHGVRLVAPDRPGYGGSDPVGEDEFATVDGAADDAAALLDELRGPGATAGVAGWSNGGWVALALAARRPDSSTGRPCRNPAPTSRCRVSRTVRPASTVARAPAATAYAALPGVAVLDQRPTPAADGGVV